MGYNGSPAIYNVLDAGPAGASGISPDDVITKMIGYPNSLKGLSWATARGACSTDGLRGPRALTFKLSPARRSEIGRLAWTGTEEQTERIRGWWERADFNSSRLTGKRSRTTSTEFQRNRDAGLTSRIES